MPQELLADASVCTNSLRAFYFVSDYTQILASLFKNLCVKFPKVWRFLSVLTLDLPNAEGFASRR